MNGRASPHAVAVPLDHRRGRAREVERGWIGGPEDDFHQGRVLMNKVMLRAGETLLDVGASSAGLVDLGRVPSGAFDVVLWNGVLHAANDKLAVLEQTRRVLRAGGRVGIAATAREREHGFELALRTVLVRLGVGSSGRRRTQGSRRVSTDEVLGWLWEAGFADISLQIRTFGDVFADPDEIVERYFATVSGALLGQSGGPPREQLMRELRAELERQRTPQGIRLERHVMFAVGRA